VTISETTQFDDATVY